MLYGVVHDVMRASGHRDFTFPAEITPLLLNQIICGPAFTIEGRVDQAADPHQTLVEWTGLLSKAKPGHIWVSQPNDHVVAHMGELSAETLQRKGVLGCVVDGNIRDVNFITDIGFQCWRRKHTPRDVVGYWIPQNTDVTIKIGDVTIASGDYLLGDQDGLVCIPAEIAASVAAEAVVAMNTESKVRKAIIDGMDPQEAYLTFGKF